MENPGGEAWAGKLGMESRVGKLGWEAEMGKSEFEAAGNAHQEGVGIERLRRECY